ncbi:hypothetical protein CB1_002231010 [Camelus ferus]|nr:hypothetical protein CB1_002231010 [Camelus ferus]
MVPVLLQAHGKNWIALIPKGNCTYRDKIRNAFLQNASAVVIFNVGSNTNETITMPHAEVSPVSSLMTLCNLPCTQQLRSRPVPAAAEMFGNRSSHLLLQNNVFPS